MKWCVSSLPPLRGFGFVTFVDQAGVDKVLAQTRHELDSKTVSPLSANLHFDWRISYFFLFIKNPETGHTLETLALISG